MKLKNTSLLITGSNRGIGRAVAIEAARRGAILHLANRTRDAQLVNELKDHGSPSVNEYAADLGTREGVEAFLKTIKKLEVDVLFNNAGQLTGGLLEEQTIDEIYSMLQVNVNALIQITHHFLPQMVKRNRGLIVNHGSVSSYMYFPCASTYSAAKAAVAAFTECLKAELKGTKVKCLLLVTPGIDTRMYKQIFTKYGAHLDTKFLSSVSPELYAVQVCDAIERGDETLSPSGSTGWALRLARHTPQVFRRVVQSRFNRNSPS